LLKGDLFNQHQADSIGDLQLPQKKFTKAVSMLKSKKREHPHFRFSPSVASRIYRMQQNRKKQKLTQIK